MYNIQLINESNNIDNIVNFIYLKQKNIKTSCKICPKEFNEIHEFINKIIKHDNVFIITINDKNIISCVCCFNNEPNDKYLECIGGFFDDELDFDYILNYLRKNYSGYNIDFIYPIENETIIDYLKNINSKIEKLQVEYLINIKNYIHKETLYNIKELMDKDFLEYKNIHNDENRYWTSDRIIKAFNIFKPYILLKNNVIIGYIDVTYGKKLIEIYDLKIIEENNKYEYMESLIITVLNNLLRNDNELLYIIEEDKLLEDICSKLGFHKIGTSQTISVIL